MKHIILLTLLLSCITLLAQKDAQTFLDTEYKAGHFNGSVLIAKKGKIIARINKGLANFQFAVPVSDSTRFPIASMTKTFTAILVLQKAERSALNLGDPITKYLTELPASLASVTIADLLTHYSGLRNEPLQAYSSRYNTTDYIKKFVTPNDTLKSISFNYNNVDYVLLTRVLEVITQKPFKQLLQENILTPLNMTNTGLYRESSIIPNLAYGYHNYTFGRGNKNDTLYNDGPFYLSNYSGAGAMYSTTEDIFKLTQALKDNRLLSKETIEQFLKKPQRDIYLSYGRGYPTIGFYKNTKTFTESVLERGGSINGFNSLLLTDKAYDKVVIILTNTDTGDMHQLGDTLFKLIN
ncbi:MAG: serine hydrolase domain-containing protein [Chitinophagaceae bacterium]